MQQNILGLRVSVVRFGTPVFTQSRRCFIKPSLNFHFHFKDTYSRIQSIFSRDNSSNGLVRASKSVLQTSGSFRDQYAAQMQPDTLKYSRLRKFGETIMIQTKNLSDIHDAIRGSSIPYKVQEQLCRQLNGGTLVRLSPNVNEYQSSEDKNGGIAYRCDLMCQYDEKTTNWSLVLVTAGLEFDLESEVQYVKETKQVPAGRKCVHVGWFENTYEDVYKTEESCKKVVIPRAISKQEFDHCISKAFYDYYVLSAEPQLKALH